MHHAHRYLKKERRKKKKENRTRSRRTFRVRHADWKSSFTRDFRLTWLSKRTLNAANIDFRSPTTGKSLVTNRSRDTQIAVAPSIIAGWLLTVHFQLPSILDAGFRQLRIFSTTHQKLSLVFHRRRELQHAYAVLQLRIMISFRFARYWFAQVFLFVRAKLFVCINEIFHLYNINFPFAQSRLFICADQVFLLVKINFSELKFLFIQSFLFVQIELLFVQPEFFICINKNSLPLPRRQEVFYLNNLCLLQVLPNI